jgi:uncharacterized membrane protein YdjX (TVP38/TMEM64 family)
MKFKGLLALGAAIVVLLLALRLHSAFGLADFKRNFAVVANFEQTSPVAAVLALFLGYLLVAALPLPFASFLTIAAGAMFGLVEGVVIASFASSLAATGAFLMSRYLFRESVQDRFGKRLEAVNRGIARDGGFYLFTLRLLPVFPFFLVNLLMGLAPVKARTFYWVSQLGMLPIAVVYVNAGTQLARLRSLEDIVSPGMLASLVLLAVFPWLAKLALGVRRRRSGRADPVSWRAPEEE